MHLSFRITITTNVIHSNCITFAIFSYVYLCVFSPFLCIFERMWLRGLKRQNISVQVACKSQVSECLLGRDNAQFLHVRKEFQSDLSYGKLVENCLVPCGCLFNTSQAMKIDDILCVTDPSFFKVGYSSIGTQARGQGCPLCFFMCGLYVFIHAVYYASKQMKCLEKAVEGKKCL